MIFKDKHFKLGVIILDDRGKSRKEVHRAFCNSFKAYFNLKNNENDLDKYISFMPEELFRPYKGTGYFYESMYSQARNFLRLDPRLNLGDLVIIDIDWGPGAGNTNGVILAEIVHDNIDLVKLIFTGSEKKEVKDKLKDEIPEIVRMGYKFYPDIFKKPDDFNIDSCTKVIEYVMKDFAKKRARYLRHNCHSNDIYELIKLANISGNHILAVKDLNGEFQEVPLKNIFFECKDSVQYREQLKHCYQAKSRFDIMKQFWCHGDVNFASHLGEEERRPRGLKLLKEGTFKEESLYRATKFFYEELKPEFGCDETRVIEEFFKEIEELIDRYDEDNKENDSFTIIVNNFLEELHSVSKKLKRRTRFFLTDLEKLIDADSKQNVCLRVPPLDSEWYCYVGDFKSNPESFEFEHLKDDGMKGHILNLWNTLDRNERLFEVHDHREGQGIILMEIKGKLEANEKHNNGGAFDLHGYSLHDRIMNGNNLKKIIQLLPHYFIPFFVESFGNDNQWHCVNFSTGNSNGYEVITAPEQFKKVTGLKALNHPDLKERGVRYVLCMERCL